MPGQELSTADWFAPQHEHSTSEQDLPEDYRGLEVTDASSPKT